MGRKESEEQNITECKICKEHKLRIQDGMFDHKNKRWRDESGLMWNGRTCPTCVQQIQAENYRKKHGVDNKKEEK